MLCVWRCFLSKPEILSEIFGQTLWHLHEANLIDHHYEESDYKFVLNFWVEDLSKEYSRLKNLNIGKMTEINKVHEKYYYFHIFDEDNNVVEITDGYNELKQAKNE